MTSTVTGYVLDNLPQTPGQALAAAAGGMLVGLLIVILLVRVLVAVGGAPSARSVIRTLDIAAVPLFIALAFILSARVLEILPLG